MTPLEALAWLGVLLVFRLAWDVLKDPWRALDLRDMHGRTDHGKVAGLSTFAALYALAWGYLGIQQELHWMIWSLLAVLPLGLIGLRIFFRATRGHDTTKREDG